MSFTTSDSKTRSVFFLKIELSGKTLRFAEEDVLAKETGTWRFFEGRLTGLSSVIAGFNDLQDSNSVISNMTFDLVNGVRNSSDSNLDSDLLNYFWPNSTVTLYLKEKSTITEIESQWRVGPQMYAGPGRRIGGGTISESFEFSGYELESSDILFKGKISFPDGIRIHEEETVRISVHDDSYNDNKLTAPNIFSIKEPENDVNFPEGNPGIESIVIPVIYGDFSKSLVLPSYQIRGFPTKENLTFKSADSNTLSSGQNALESIGTVKAGTVAVSTTATDLSDGDFDIDIDDVNQNAGDVFLGASGKTRGTAITNVFGGSSSDLLENPVEIIYDLLVNRLGVDSSLIDESSFTTAQSTLSDAKARAFIGNDTRITEAIRAIAFEFSIDLHNLFGSWYLNALPYNPSTSDLSIDQDDIRTDTFQIKHDPNKLYFNRFSIRLEQRPIDNGFNRSLIFDHKDKQTEHGFVQDFDYEFKWVYRTVDALERLGNMMGFTLRPLRQVSFSCAFRAWNIQPNDVITVTYGPLSSQKVLVRRVQKNPRELSTDIFGWVLPTRKTRVYASSSQAAPTSYTDASSASYGVFHADLNIVSGFNDKIEFTTDAAYTATLDSAYYASGTALASEIQSKMNAQSTTRTITVTYNTVSRKFRFQSDDGNNWSINWTNDKELGRSSLGFDTSADDSSAAEYFSDYVAVFDTSDSERVSEYA